MIKTYHLAILIAFFLVLLYFLYINKPIYSNPVHLLKFSRKYNSSNGSIHRTNILECREFSDLTSYCLYENVCLENNEFLFLTNQPDINQAFEFNGRLKDWDHYEPVDLGGSVIDRQVNNPLPYRSFINGRYVSSSYKKDTINFQNGCHSILSFDFFGHNIFHWSMKVSPLFLYQHYNKFNNDNKCKNFTSIRLVDRKLSDINEWQKRFLEISTGLKVEGNNYDFTNEPNRKQETIQCFKYFLVPGTAIYLFTGPREAIDFRKRVSQELNLNFVRERIVLVKRKSRLIKNQNELEDFIRSKFDNSSIDIIFLEELNFTQQVEKMSKAKLLIAVHGAGLTNAIFLPSTSAVIEITAPHFYYPLYERISVQSGHFYFKFVTQYDPTLHSDKYSNRNSRTCMLDGNCVVHWKDASIKVDINKFSIMFEQVMEIL
ncbi:unnamed protein product [Brachionus calyciflorus]|uniref:Glycosyltransferase 61 catalytic domain-containing protein n=1 Tax=Brachionus calyciflorus TaxID=104777 RepID=A0A814GQ29_9BILA|nr:unnamed protein product [Brachionus calyciflorus]